MQKSAQQRKTQRDWKSWNNFSTTTHDAFLHQLWLYDLHAVRERRLAQHEGPKQAPEARSESQDSGYAKNIADALRQIDQVLLAKNIGITEGKSMYEILSSARGAGEEAASKAVSWVSRTLAHAKEIMDDGASHISEVAEDKRDTVEGNREARLVADLQDMMEGLSSAQIIAAILEQYGAPVSEDALYYIEQKRIARGDPPIQPKRVFKPYKPQFASMQPRHEHIDDDVQLVSEGKTTGSAMGDAAALTEKHIRDDIRRKEDRRQQAIRDVNKDLRNQWDQSEKAREARVGPSTLSGKITEVRDKGWCKMRYTADTPLLNGHECMVWKGTTLVTRAVVWGEPQGGYAWIRAGEHLAKNTIDTTCVVGPGEESLRRARREGAEVDSKDKTKSEESKSSKEYESMDPQKKIAMLLESLLNSDAKTIQTISTIADISQKDVVAKIQSIQKERHTTSSLHSWFTVRTNNNIHKVYFYEHGKISVHSWKKERGHEKKNVQVSSAEEALAMLMKHEIQGFKKREIKKELTDLERLVIEDYETCFQVYNEIDEEGSVAHIEPFGASVAVPDEDSTSVRRPVGLWLSLKNELSTTEEMQYAIRNDFTFSSEFHMQNGKIHSINLLFEGDNEYTNSLRKKVSTYVGKPFTKENIEQVWNLVKQNIKEGVAKDAQAKEKLPSKVNTLGVKKVNIEDLHSCALFLEEGLPVLESIIAELRNEGYGNRLDQLTFKMNDDNSIWHTEDAKVQQILIGVESLSTTNKDEAKQRFIVILDSFKRSEKIQQTLKIMKSDDVEEIKKITSEDVKYLYHKLAIEIDKTADWLTENFDNETTQKASFLTKYDQQLQKFKLLSDLSSAVKNPIVFREHTYQKIKDWIEEQKKKSSVSTEQMKKMKNIIQTSEDPNEIADVKKHGEITDDIKEVIQERMKTLNLIAHIDMLYYRNVIEGAQKKAAVWKALADLIDADEDTIVNPEKSPEYTYAEYIQILKMKLAVVEKRETVIEDMRRAFAEISDSPLTQLNWRSEEKSNVEIGEHGFYVPEPIRIYYSIRLKDTVTQLPESIQSIQGRLYSSDGALQTLPDSLTSVDELVLVNCTDLTSLGGLQRVNMATLTGCTKLHSLPSGLHVKNELDIRDTAITNLPHDLSVGAEATIIIDENQIDVESLPPNLRKAIDMRRSNEEMTIGSSRTADITVVREDGVGTGVEVTPPIQLAPGIRLVTTYTDALPSTDYHLDLDRGMWNRFTWGQLPSAGNSKKPSLAFWEPHYASPVASTFFGRCKGPLVVKRESKDKFTFKSEGGKGDRGLQLQIYNDRFIIKPYRLKEGTIFYGQNFTVFSHRYQRAKFDPK